MFASSRPTTSTLVTKNCLFVEGQVACLDYFYHEPAHLFPQMWGWSTDFVRIVVQKKATPLFNARQKNGCERFSACHSPAFEPRQPPGGRQKVLPA